jgi:hypothetical protein
MFVCVSGFWGYTRICAAAGLTKSGFIEESRSRNPSEDVLVAIASRCITVRLITLENFSKGFYLDVAI